MYSTSSAASADLVSGLKELGCEPSPSAKSTPFVAQCWPSIGQASLFPEMSDCSMPAPLRNASISSAEDSPAKTLASPARGLDLVGSALDCGANIEGSSRRLGRGGSSSKTSAPFALADWKQSSGSSLRSGMTRNGIVFPLAPLARLTSAIESGLLPTPKASTGGAWIPLHGTGMNLKARLQLLPTPRKCSGLRSSGSNRTELYNATGRKIGKTTLRRFEEWMMGYPAGWTDLPLSETQSFQLSPKSSASQSCAPQAE